MPTEKTKQPGESNARWANQVARTADGRFVVRGVDVPAKGGSWARVVAGEHVRPKLDQARSSTTGQFLTPITNKSKALATAKRAGVTGSSKVTQVKK